MKKPLVDIYERYEQDRVARGETKDCTVVSLAVLTCGRYGKAHTVMRMTSGRSDRKGAHLLPAAEYLGFEPVKGIDDENKISLGEFCSAHSRGRYWVKVSGHALAVINGQIHDYTLGPRRRVSEAYKVPHDPA